MVIEPGGKCVIVQKLRYPFPQHPRSTSEPGRRHFIRGGDDEAEHEVPEKQPDGDFKNLHGKHRLTWPLFLQRTHSTPLFPSVRSDSSEHAQRIAIGIHVHVVAVLIVGRVQTFARVTFIHGPRRALDVSRARALLGWEAQTPFEEGLRRTIDWWRTHKQ